MTIGLLVPRSGLYPGINFDLTSGLKAGLSYTGTGTVQLATENIGFATDDQLIYAAAEKLLLNNADLVAGYVNPRTAEKLNSLFEHAGRFFIALDSGYHFPEHGLQLSNIITLSLQGGLCCRSVGRLAAGASQYLALAASYYDAGYRAPFTFTRGAEDAGGHIGFNHITALKKKEFTLAPLQQYLKDSPTGALLAAFSGDMAEDFYRHRADITDFEQLRTFVSPFMAEEQLLDRLECTVSNTFTVVPWSKELALPANAVFTDAMQAAGRTANVFSLLGWEAGLTANHLAKNKPAPGSQSPFSIDSPRGTLLIQPGGKPATAPIYQARISSDKAGKPTLTDITEVAFMKEELQRLETDILNTMHLQLDTWKNAYPCID